MNNYYETEPAPSCGIGNHSEKLHRNGKCMNCDTYVPRELDQLIPRVAGKHKKV